MTPQQAPLPRIARCPFCGGDAAVLAWRDPNPDIGPSFPYYHVVCGGCGASSPMSTGCFRGGQEEAITAWNRCYKGTR